MIILRRSLILQGSGSIIKNRPKYYLSLKHKVVDLINNSVAIINDEDQQIPFMSEIELENKNKGIVLKI